VMVNVSERWWIGFVLSIDEIIEIQEAFMDDLVLLIVWHRCTNCIPGGSQQEVDSRDEWICDRHWDW